MSDDNTTTDTPDWNAIVGTGGSASTATAAAAPEGAAPAAAAKAAPMNTLPELPLVVGRIPVRYDTRRAVISLPKAYKGVKCAFLSANTGAFSSPCGIDGTDVPVPAVRDARPAANGKDIIVNFWPERTNGGVETGTGWEEDAYGSGQLTTRVIEEGVPYVEVEIKVNTQSLDCGCKDPDDGWG